MNGKIQTSESIRLSVILALRYMLPIIAFAAGVFVAECISQK